MRMNHSWWPCMSVSRSSHAPSEKGATVYRVMREQQVNWPKWSETGRRGPRPADAASHGTRRRRRPVRRSNQTASQRHEVSLSQSGRSAHERTSARSLSPYTSSEVLTIDWGKRNHQNFAPLATRTTQSWRTCGTTCGQARSRHRPLQTSSARQRRRSH